MNFSLLSSSRFVIPQFRVASIFSRQYCHHALFIGGGVCGKTLTRFVRPHLPEQSEYLELKLISDKFKQIKEIHPESPKILFGNGENKFVVQRPGVISNLLRKMLGIQNVFPIESLENLNGSASLEHISHEFTNLSNQLKAGDHLLIYLTGHGLIFRGTVLWNEAFTKQYISPKFLRSELQKLPQGVSIKLYVDSCYSGIYQELSTSDITVFSTSTDTEASLYTPGKVNKSTELIFNNLNESNLLIPFSLGSMESNNFYATDSLSYFIGTHLRKKSVLFKTKRVWREYNKKILQLIPSYIGSFTASVAIAIACVFDPTGIIEGLYYSKMALIFGKASLPFVKVFTVIALSNAFPKTTVKLSNQWKKTDYYKKRYVFEEQRLINKLNSNQQPLIPKELTEAEKEAMQSIFQALKDLKTIRSNDISYIHYYYLYDKAILFTHTASIEQLRTFIKIAKNVVLSNMSSSL